MDEPSAFVMIELIPQSQHEQRSPIAPIYPQPNTMDAFVLVEMAAKAEEVGVKKAAMGLQNTIFLAVMAGQFISLGANFATTVATGVA